MIAAALVSHGQELRGTPPAELLASCGMVLTTIAAALLRVAVLRRQGSSS